MVFRFCLFCLLILKNVTSFDCGFFDNIECIQFCDGNNRIRECADDTLICKDKESCALMCS